MFIIFLFTIPYLEIREWFYLRGKEKRLGKWEKTLKVSENRPIKE